MASKEVKKDRKPEAPAVAKTKAEDHPKNMDILPNWPKPGSTTNWGSAEIRNI